MSKFQDILAVLRGDLSTNRLNILQQDVTFWRNECNKATRECNEVKAKLAFLDPLSPLKQVGSKDIGDKILNELHEAERFYCNWCGRNNYHIKGVCVVCGTTK